MAFVIPLLALGVSAVAFRGRPPTWVLALAAVCLAALLTTDVYGVIYRIVHWHGSELLLPTALAALLAVSLVFVLRWLAPAGGRFLAREGHRPDRGVRV
jgi:hypothetical protein